MAGARPGSFPGHGEAAGIDGDGARAGDGGGGGERAPAQRIAAGRGIEQAQMRQRAHRAGEAETDRLRIGLHAGAGEGHPLAGIAIFRQLE